MPVGRVVLQSEQVAGPDGTMRYRLGGAEEQMCPSTPCFVDLPEGNVLLQFPVIGADWVEPEIVHVDRGTSVYRRSLSVYTDETGGVRVLGILGTSIGSAAFITGLALLPVGLGDDESDGLAIAGGITLGAGAALLALGIWMIYADSPTYRPGTAIHFDLGG